MNRIPVIFIEYLTRPLGFFFASVDTDKVAERIRVRYHATQDGSWGLTFVKYYGIQNLYRGRRALGIYCRVPLSAAGITNFSESMGIYCRVPLISRWEYMTSYM